MAKLVAINDDNFEKEVLLSNIPVVLWIIKNGSESLKMLPVTEEIKKEFQDRLNYGLINISTSPNTAKKSNITVAPQVYIFQSGCHVATILGDLSKEEIASKINRVLNPQLVSIYDSTFDEKVMQSGKPVVVMFAIEDCPCCKALRSIMDQVADQFKDKINVFQIDALKNEEKTDEYDIRAVPQLLFFRDGEIMDSIIGVRPIDEIESGVNKFLEKIAES